MVKRIRTAAVMIAVFIGMLFLRQIENVIFDVFLLLVGGMGLYEILASLRAGGFKPIILGAIISYALMIATYFVFGAGGIGIYLILAIIINLVFYTFSSDRDIKDFFATLFTAVYPLIFVYLALIVNNEGGLVALMLTIFISVMTDSMAYFVGVIVKGPKLCPTISPKKTIAGLVGGLIGGVIGSVAAYLVFEHYSLMGFADVTTMGFGDSALIVYIAVGLVGAILNTLGDLATSRIKRNVGIKDFGKIFPGHGGIMDRIDGLVFVVPLVYLLVVLL